MIQTLLGLRADAAEGRLSLRPKLPDWLSRVCVRRLRVGNRLVEFEVVREEKRTPVEIFDSGGLEIVVEPAAEAIGKGRL
jgi:hypothetical protein